MNLTPILLILVVLLLLYIILFTDGRKGEKEREQSSPSPDDRRMRMPEIMGQSKAPFPLEGILGNPKESNEKSLEKAVTFASESISEASEKNAEKSMEENEFQPMASENEVDADEVEREELALLLEEEIELSTESLTSKEIRLLQEAAERKSVSEEEQAGLQETVDKLRGSDFLEKIRQHELEQGRIQTELMRKLSRTESTDSDESSPPIPEQEDWTSFL